MKRRHKLTLICLALLVTILGVWRIGPSTLGHGDRLIALDVGQGDAIFIDLASGRQVLIDGGKGDAVLQALGEVMAPWDRSIDLVVLTHPDQDHLDGLLSVLKRYQVTTVLTRTLPEVDMPLYQKWQALLLSSGVGKIEARPAQRLKLDDNYWLGLDMDTSPNLDTNDSSLILTLNQGSDCEAILTGDASTKVEKRLVEDSPLNLDCDVLKLGHHGSKTSTSTLFLAAVTPKVALISAGKDNSYGHPHPEVMAQLSGIEVYRTDQTGNVILEL